ncbi:MAG: DUF5320 domain-containing protein [Fervidicoccus sp.]
MAWGKRFGTYPGNGPWSNLPPWERPGWKYGRGWCWQGYGRVAWPYSESPLNKEEEIRYLEEQKKYLEDSLKEIDERLKVLKNQ